MFKSHPSLEVELAAGINFIVGPNGIGKTNVLEAISYLCLGKSAFYSHDRYTAHKEQEGHAAHFSTIGWWQEEGTGHMLKVQVSQAAGSKKQIKYNDEALPKLADHVGKYPMVMVAPDDVYLIREGGEERRKFFDTLLCQLSQTYLHSAMAYNHLLNQRNAVLKQAQETGIYNQELLLTYAHKMAPEAVVLMRMRQEVVVALGQVFTDLYAYISKGKEVPAITYVCHAPEATNAEELEQLWAAQLSTDLAAGRTTVGPHKDDFQFLLDAEAIKNYGSQGQQKSFLLALKLAQYQYLHAQKGYHPTLLLDDVFDKLDADRIKALLQLVAEGRFSQIFITDAQAQRCQNWASETGITYHLIDLTKTKV